MCQISMARYECKVDFLRRKTGESLAPVGRDPSQGLRKTGESLSYGPRPHLPYYPQPPGLLLADYSCKTNHVSSIRLFILGTLAASGPLHGHQIRQQALADRAETYSDVQVGSVYGALKRLANEDLIREVRTEKVGNRPERTVYEITSEGCRSLAAIHDKALRELDRHHDPFDLALAQARDVPIEHLEQIVENRIAALGVQLAEQRHAAETADPYLNEAERLVIQHLIVRTEAEIRWHTEVAARLAKIAADFANGVGGPQHLTSPESEGTPR
jgi:DNA-binding PadR family transcriptional regulator